MNILGVPKIIYIYNAGIKKLNFKELKKFIHETFGKIKVNLVKLTPQTVYTQGLLFDFIATEKAFKTNKYSKVKSACHIILTERLFATDDAQEKIHLRAAIFSSPTVISTSGIVEGPAKPREYYLYKQKFSQLGVWDIEEPRIKQKFAGRFLDYADKRMPEVLKGYIAQGIFFYITGEPFCQRKTCRLYNAHWQEELIYSQIKQGSFCKEHKAVLKEIKGSHLKTESSHLRFFFFSLT